MSSLENVQALQDKLFYLNLLTTSQLSKSLNVFVSQLDPHNIVQFFKCMESSCDFCTDEEDLFMDHLSVHTDLSLQCTYCKELAPSEGELIKHMVGMHGSCRFQCALCFYRSQSETHIRVHSLVVHKSKSVSWHVCRERLPSETNRVCSNRNQIQGYACTGDCSFKSVCEDRFLKHLLTEHTKSRSFSCHICSKQVDGPGAVINHCTEKHGLYAFHCLYCQFGSQNDWDVVTHVASCHSDKPFKIYCRNEKMPLCFTALNELGRCNLNEGVSASPAVNQCPEDACEQNAVHKKASNQPEVEMGTDVRNCLPVNQEGVEGALTKGNSEIKCKCGSVFKDVAVYMQHITDDHSEVRFDCPKCVRLRNGSVRDLFSHLVDCHTTCFRCVYKSCNFISESQQGIDDHIIEMHQHFDLLEETSPARQEGNHLTAGATEAAEVESDVACFDSKTVRDVTQPGATPKVSPPEGENKQLPGDQVRRYACSLCYQCDMKSLDYFRHMSWGHGVKLFCGLCEKGYKVRKQLMLHHSRCHPGLPLSVKSFERNELRDVTLHIQQDWEDDLEARDEVNKAVVAATSATATAEAAKSSDNGSSVSHARLSTPLHETPCYEGKQAAKHTGKAQQHRRRRRASFFCGHCLKRYKLLRRLATHMETVHPGLEPAVKEVGVAKEDAAKVAEKFKDVGTVAGVDAGVSPSKQKETSEIFDDNDDSEDNDLRKSESKDESTSKHKLINSESEGEDCNNSGLDTQQEGFSYYGKEVEPIDYSNTYVRFYEEDFRMVCSELVCIINFQPVVLLRKGKFPLT